MITSKKQMLQVMKNCEGADTLTREEKFQVFVNVCDNMLNEGRMTKDLPTNVSLTFGNHEPRSTPRSIHSMGFESNVR